MKASTYERQRVRNIGQRIKLIRLMWGWSWDTMANHLRPMMSKRISPNTLRNLAEGKVKRPHENTMWALQGALSVMEKYKPTPTPKISFTVWGAGGSGEPGKNPRGAA